jgi:hypothetical protein
MPTAWHTAPNGHGGLALWTNNNTYTVPYYNWGRWYANIPAPGFYSVQIYIPGGIGTTHNARYWISHAGNYDLRPVNQALYANQWVEVGVFFFNAGSQYVSLADVTYEPAFATTIVFDSVKFSPR